jgi:serine/threonine protein kinase
MDSDHDTAPPASADSTSRWARAVAGDREALHDLAGSYWYAVYAWWRRCGAEDAANATAASFGRWLTDAPPKLKDTGASRLRTWLKARLAALAETGVESAADPGIEIAPKWAEAQYAHEPDGSPDDIFDRRWALTILEFVTAAVREEYAARGQDSLFAEVSPYASFAGGDEDRYESTAQRLGSTTGSVRKAVFEFRTRHRELLRDLIADTVADPAEVESELTALLCACDIPGAPGESGPLPSAIRQFKPDELLARAMRSVHMTSGGAGMWMPPTNAEVARLFPQYEMLGILGRGGMGAVYKARQIELDRLVAIKLLPLEVSVDQAFADRFRREARAMARLGHPNIIAVHDFGTTKEGHLYFVMEFVEGGDLSDLIHGRARGEASGIAAPRALEILMSVCDALHFAHGKGVIHRDIKPANVMVSSEGHVKVADFGLARLTDTAGEQHAGRTVAGMVVGTPDYMAPEQKRGQPVDQRADIYSLGVMLYEMLLRETPQGAFDLPSQRGIDKRVDPIITRALATQPERRYQSATEMKAELAKVHEALKTPAPSSSAAALQHSFKPAIKSPPILPAEPKPLTPPPAPVPTQTRQPSRVRKPRRVKPWIFAGVVVLVAAGAFIFRQKLAEQAKQVPVSQWAGAIRERTLGAGSGVGVQPAGGSEKWVSAREPGRIKSGNYVHTQNGLVPGPNEQLLFDTGGAVRDGAVRIRLARPAANAVRLFARMGSGDYSASLSGDKVTIRGGLHGASYADLRSFPLPAAASKTEDIEMELRVVGPKISVKVNGTELGSVEDRAVTSGGLGAGFNKPEKVVVKALEYLVLDTKAE